MCSTNPDAVGSSGHVLLVAGLGNPGERYERTRHNAGFAVLDALASRLSCRFAGSRFNGLLAEGQDALSGSRLLLLKPQTFMNLSGLSVQPAMRWYRLEPSRDLLVISDDLDLPPGRLRLRAGGSAGGQKGLASVIQHLGTDQFARLRVGVGRPVLPGMDAASYVLLRPGVEEAAVLDAAVSRAAEAVLDWSRNGTTLAANRVNAQ